MNYQINQELSQKQVLAPQMFQSLDLLRMSNGQLQDYLREYARENPTVEIVEPSTIISKNTNQYYQTDFRDDFISQIEDQGNDLYDELMFQLHGLNIPIELEQEIILLIDSLDNSGYLPQDVAYYEEDKHPKLFYHALQILHSFEPYGIGARNLSECLIIQLRKKQNPGLAIEIAENYLQMMASRNYLYIAKSTGTSIDEVKNACKMIVECNPKPTNGYLYHEKTEYIFPDIIVSESENGNIQVSLSTSNETTIKIRQNYLDRVSNEKKDVEALINKQIKQAEMIISFINKRKTTLLLCAKLMVQKQTSFFIYGKQFLQPLSMQVIANELNLSISTVSRTINGKYMKCKYGVLPLKVLLMRTTELFPVGGQTRNAFQIRYMINNIIQNENKQKPLKDSEIVDILKQSGIIIARRTIAKYRDELGIPAVRQRKNNDL